MSGSVCHALASLSRYTRTITTRCLAFEPRFHGQGNACPSPLPPLSRGICRTAGDMPAIPDTNRTFRERTQAMPDESLHRRGPLPLAVNRSPRKPNDSQCDRTYAQIKVNRIDHRHGLRIQCSIKKL